MNGWDAASLSARAAVSYLAASVLYLNFWPVLIAFLLVSLVGVATFAILFVPPTNQPLLKIIAIYGIAIMVAAPVVTSGQVLAAAAWWLCASALVVIWTRTSKERQTRL